MLNINTTHVKILKIQVCYTNRNIIMNFVVVMADRVNHKRL